MMLEALLATLLTLAGVGGVRLAWKAGRAGRLAAQRNWRLIGWGLVVVSGWPWMLAGGADRGIAIGIIAFMLAGLCLVAVAAWQVSRQPRRQRNGNGNAANTENGGSSSRAASILVFVLAGPVAGVISLLLTIDLHAALDALGVAAQNRLASELIVFPVAWTLLMMLACYPASLQRRTIAFSVLLLVAAIPVFGVA